MSSNYMIVSQEATVNKEPVSVDCKEISWRPSSPKEVAAGGGEFKRLGTPTFRVMFKHVVGKGVYKVVAQYVKKKRAGSLVKIGGVQQFEWRVNLHYPDKLVKKHLMTRNRLSTVSIPCPSGKMITEKTSTGTHPYNSFFDRVFPNTMRCSEFRQTVEELLSEAIFDREEKKAAA